MQRAHRLLVLASIFLAPALSQAATAFTVRTNDGLGLGLDAHGVLQEVTAGGAALPLLGPGGFFVSEVTGADVPLPMDGATRSGTPLLGIASQTGANEITISGILDAPGISFTAVITGGPALHVSLHIGSTRAVDRAFVAYFRVPVNGAGGTWSTGIDDARTLGTGRAYDSFGWFQNYRTTTSASPLAVVTLGGNGLALAIPPTAPAIYRLTYQPPYGFQVEWEVGAAPDTTAFPQAAQVEALLYAAAPPWGYRAALKRLYLLFPDLWTKRAQDGSWYLDEGGLTSIANPEDFAIRFSETNDWRSGFTTSHGIYALKYTEPWSDHLETDPSGLRTWAQDTAANASAKTLISKGEPRLVTAQAALLSGVIGRDGQYAGWSDPANFTDAEGTLRYILNPDVQIPNWLGFTASAAGLTNPLNREQAVEAYEAFRRWGVQPSSAADVYDGIYLDSTNTTGNGWTGWHFFNFRREHFATTSVPLVFDPQTGKVALSQALSSLAAMRRIADLLHGRGEIVMANGLPDPFIFSTGAFCDFVSPGEGYDGTLSVLREVRAASYAKPIAYLYNSAVTDQQFQHAMLYAVFPGGAGISGNRTAYQRWAPIMMEIGGAGWEPLTFARSDDPRVLVERYGRLDRGALHFVVHRESGGTAASNLLLEKATLGIGADVQIAVRDVASGAAMTAVDNGDTLSLPLRLALEQSAVLALTAVSGTPGPTAGETLPSDPPPSGGGGSDGGVSDGGGGGSGGGGAVDAGSGRLPAGDGSGSPPVAASAVGSGCSTGAAGPGVFGLLALAFAFRRRRGRSTLSA